MGRSREHRYPNNFRCFEGLGERLWRAVAAGHATQNALPKVEQRQDGSALIYQEDIDGAAVQNGGIQKPMIEKMRPGAYFYRFFSARDCTRWGEASFRSGTWWIDYETLVEILHWAERFDMTLSGAAQRLLAIPKEWSDCAHLGRAELRTTLKAYTGRGKPASPHISPDSDRRASALYPHRRGVGGATLIDSPLSMPPAHLPIKQYCVPGSRALLNDFFVPRGTIAANRRGLGRPLFPGDPSG